MGFKDCAQLFCLQFELLKLIEAFNLSLLHNMRCNQYSKDANTDLYHISLKLFSCKIALLQYEKSDHQSESVNYGVQPDVKQRRGNQHATYE